MDSVTIQVSTYSGYKANERPVYFFLEGSKIDIREILKQWKDPEYDCFTVRGANQKRYLLKWERARDRWFAENKTEVANKEDERYF